MEVKEEERGGRGASWAKVTLGRGGSSRGKARRAKGGGADQCWQVGRGGKGEGEGEGKGKGKERKVKKKKNKREVSGWAG